MNPLQKLSWGLVLFAGLATAAAGIAALVSPAPEPPVLGDLANAVPASLRGQAWAGQVVNGSCDRCVNQSGTFKLLGGKLASESGVEAQVIDNSGSGEEAQMVSAGLLGIAGPPTGSSEIVLKNLGEVGDWSFVADDGARYGSTDLGARIWIADFIFTRCAGPCPLMCEAMKTLVKRLPDNPRLRFVSFSVDPKHDTPEVLREFRKQWDAPERWKFVTAIGVFNLAYDGFKLLARPNPEPAPGSEFIHSTRFTLVDGRGRMRGAYVYDYENPESVGPLVDAIVRDARALLETPERVVDHAHDARVHLVDGRGRVRGVYAPDREQELIRDARRVAVTADRLLSVRSLPKLNAALNGTSFLFLSLGLAFILKKNVARHKVCMTTALVASALFLVSYLAYHVQVGSVKYGGEGVLRVAYFGILLTHTVLAVAVAPLALITVSRAWRGTFDRHVAIARWTLPMWMYVSLTGILVYLMLYRLG